MSSKLTLSIEQGVIVSAKEYASSQGRSLSKIVEEYLKSLTSREKLAVVEEPQAAFHPLIEELAGSVKFPEGKTDEEILGEARMEKYLLTMKKVFVDADVIIDFLTMRAPFGEDAKRLFQYGIGGKIDLYTSALALANTNYIIGKITSSKTALVKIKKLLPLVKICQIDQHVVDLAAQSLFSDFEDALQNFSADEANIDVVSTRNVKDYKHSALAVLTPKELVAKLTIG